MELINKIIRDEDGQSMVEYGLIVGVVAIVCIASYTTLGKSVNDIINKLAKKVDAVGKNIGR